MARDRVSAPGKIRGYYLPRPALTYDCGHKLPLVFRRFDSILRLERLLCAANSWTRIDGSWPVGAG